MSTGAHPDSLEAAKTSGSSTERVEAAVVGAGSAGLWAAAELKRRGVHVVVLERTDAVASAWRHRYDGLRLNTVRWLSNLPGAPIPSHSGRWPDRDDFIAYLEGFAELVSSAFVSARTCHGSKTEVISGC